ncbi:hypothetical protein C8R43DRAFT_1014023 [Mycena crocata]|nr:hypothetical protein C8R43DRAFT_1014023 [Mycena crocata]
MASLAPCLVMPGGSWTFEEEESVQRLANALETTVTCSADHIQPHGAPSEIVMLNPAKLEEIVTLPSPTNTATWRVRISPDYVEVLPSGQQENEVMQTIRDSPDQRRSRFLDTVFPEFKDDLHSVSRNSIADDGDAASDVDLEWDFAQGGVPGENGISGVEKSSLRRENSENVLALDFDALASHGVESVAPFFHSTEDSSLDDNDTSSQSSQSAPAAQETCAYPAHFSPDVPHNGLDSPVHSDAEEPPDDHLLLTPSSLDDTEPPQHDDSESMLSIALHLATASIRSDTEKGHGLEASDRDELEYLEEYPAVTLSVLQLDVPLSLESDFGVPRGWEVISDPPSSPSSRDDALSADDIASSHSSILPPPAPASNPPMAGADEEPADIAHFETVQSPVMSSDGQSVSQPETDNSKIPGCTVPQDTVEEDGATLRSADAVSIGAEFEDESIQGTPALPALHLQSPSFSDDVLSSPEFHRRDFLDQDTPRRDFAPSSSLPKARRHSRALSTSIIERTSILWAPQESKILQDAPARSGNAKGKGKGRARPRARTISDDSRFAETSQTRPRCVDQAVQTEPDELRAKYKRLKRELKEEKAKVAGLRRKDSQQRPLFSKMRFWVGDPFQFEDEDGIM